MLIPLTWAGAVARCAGFPERALATALSVCIAESGLNTSARNTAGNHPPSTDRGLWQINSYWHPEVPDAAAYSALGSARAAFRISCGGSVWGQWSTYNSGSYLHSWERVRSYLRACDDLRQLKLEAVGPRSRKHDVTLLQEALGALDVDGLYGPLTAARVVRLQVVAGLPASGLAGRSTLAALGW
jgi:peptidoglycan hydrolase-like protein with peptidoglycan-binding domain